MATTPSVLAWEIPRTDESTGPQESRTRLGRHTPPGEDMSGPLQSFGERRCPGPQEEAGQVLGTCRQGSDGLAGPPQSGIEYGGYIRCRSPGPSSRAEA